MYGNTALPPAAEQYSTRYPSVDTGWLHCASKYINYTTFSTCWMCCITGFPQVCCGVKDVADVTASEAEHMDNKAIKYSFAECSFG